MSLFGDIGEFFEDVGQSVVQIAKKPLKAVVAVSTFGSSLAYEKYAPRQVKAVAPLVAGAVASAVTLNPLPLTLATAYTRAIAAPARSAVQRQPVVQQGAKPMGLDVGGILGAVGNLFGGVSSVPALQTFGNVVSSFAPAFSPQPTYNVQPMAQPMMVANRGVPAIRGGTTMTQEIFNAGAKVLNQLGVQYSATTGSFSSALKRTLSGIASLARRTPTGTIVGILAGLGLTALESNLLVAWHAQRKRGRRMNPANSKALRRAARRIKSFHRLCVHTDVLKTRSRSRTGSRCGTCRKSPCRC